MRIVKMVEQRQFQVSWYPNYIIWSDDAGRRVHKYTLLCDDTIRRLTGLLDVLTHLAPFIKQDDSAGSRMLAVTGKEQSYEVVRGEVNQIGVASIMLDLGQKFPFVGLKCERLGCTQAGLLDMLHIQLLDNIRGNPFVFPVQAGRNLVVAFGFAAKDVIATGRFQGQFVDDCQRAVQVGRR